MKRFFAALIALAFAAPAQAAPQTSFDKAAFFNAYSLATSEIYRRDGGGHRGLTNVTESMKAPTEVPNVAPGGAWRAVLGISCQLPGTNISVSKQANQVMSFQAPCVTANYGDKFVYLFQTQAISETYFDAVQKAVEAKRKEFEKEIKDVQTVFEFLPDRTYRVTSVYSYAGGTSQGKVTDRLVDLMSKSKFLLCDINTAIELHKVKRWSQLRGKITPPLTKDDFVILYPTFAQAGYEVSDPANRPHGQWSMGNKKYGLWVENFGDAMKIWVRVPQAKPANNQPVVDQILAELKTKVKASKGATGPIEAMWDDANIWIGNPYSYASMSGRDVMDTVEYSWQKYTDTCYDDVQKVLKKYR